MYVLTIGHKHTMLLNDQMHVQISLINEVWKMSSHLKWFRISDWVRVYLLFRINARFFPEFLFGNNHKIFHPGKIVLRGESIIWMTHEALIRWSAADSLPQENTFLPKIRECQIKGQVSSLVWSGPWCCTTDTRTAQKWSVRNLKQDLKFWILKIEIKTSKPKAPKPAHATIRVTISHETFLCAVDNLILV